MTAIDDCVTTASVLDWRGEEAGQRRGEWRPVRDTEADQLRDGNHDVVDENRHAPEVVHETARDGVDRLDGEEHEDERPDPVHGDHGAAGDEGGGRQAEQERRQQEQAAHAGERGKGPRRHAELGDAPRQHDVPDDDDQRQREVRRREERWSSALARFDVHLGGIQTTGEHVEGLAEVMGRWSE